MRVLLVEDEPQLSKYVRRGLEEAAWTADIAGSLAQAWHLLQANSYDVVVLDLGLPDGDGLDLLRRARQAQVQVPVLVLTARGSVENRIAGLNAGADDYLGKPFAFAELLARLHALLRRRQGGRSPTVRVGDLELDVPRRCAQRAGRRIDLTAREFGVLELLMRHAGEVVTRTMLAEDVWGEHYDSLSNLIEVFINRLRKKIENADEPRLLHTIRGSGYMMRDEAE